MTNINGAAGARGFGGGYYSVWEGMLWADRSGFVI